MSRFFDYWVEGTSEGVPNLLYTLIDPRDNQICYIGITKQSFKNRLAQHRNPIPTNMTAIAKLQRHLKTLGMTIQGEARVKGDEEFISGLEERLINSFWRVYGKYSLKNHQSGGRDAFKNSSESIRKALITKVRNTLTGNRIILRGDSSPTSKISSEDVIKIYSMINQFYTNKEILKELDLNIGLTGVNQIRQGVNWKELFIKYNMKVIPSMYTTEGALNSQQKIEVMKLLETGTDIYKIKEMYGLSVTDLKRIREKTLWKLSWNIYDNYYKQLNK